MMNVRRKGMQDCVEDRTKGRRLERLIDTASFGHIRRYRGAGGIDRAASIVQKTCAANDSTVH